jgi:hypothetical protein
MSYLGMEKLKNMSQNSNGPESYLSAYAGTPAVATHINNIEATKSAAIVSAFIDIACTE